MTNIAYSNMSLALTWGDLTVNKGILFGTRVSLLSDRQLKRKIQLAMASFFKQIYSVQ